MPSYSFTGYQAEQMARALGRDLSISTKQSIEICNYLRKRKLQDAKQILEDVIQLKRAIPFKRFTERAGHKPGSMGSGKYPIKASKTLLKLLQSVEANAQQKGLNTANLVITHINAHGAGKAWHYGRRMRREMKRTHVEIVVEERRGKEEESKKGQRSVSTHQTAAKTAATSQATAPAAGTAAKEAKRKTP
ncbi:50S ribosomal protein L22 [Candidatus Woesearchaeota archaeon]|nr:50S ribosomal protein L22 [Candidatus Woesearchaeota archaeon]